MSCAKCERPFLYGTEDTVTINRKTYHSDCLACDHCSKPYDGSFTPDDFDKEALCRECIHQQRTKSAKPNEKDSSKESKASSTCCGGCGLPFNPNSRHITKKYRDKEYHHNCLKCKECQKLIEGEIYEDEQGNQIFCTACFKRRDQKSFQRQSQQKKEGQQKSVHFAEKLAETLNRDELAAYYKNSQADAEAALYNNGEQIPYCGACMMPFYPGCRITHANEREYHYECFRCEKCGQPINQTFTISPDGSKFQCGSCVQKLYRSTPTKLCAGCDQLIDLNTGGRIEFNRRSYHPECFTCAVCQRQLNPSQTFTLRDDQPWCRQCEVSVKNCFNCGRAILSSGITYETREYHVECFKCSHCQKLLENESILCANELKPYCVQCNDELFAKRCFKCRGIIPHDTKYIVVDEKPYHDQCFLCAKCHRPIGTKKFYKETRGFTCANCSKS